MAVSLLRTAARTMTVEDYRRLIANGVDVSVQEILEPVHFLEEKPKGEVVGTVDEETALLYREVLELSALREEKLVEKNQRIAEILARSLGEIASDREKAYDALDLLDKISAAGIDRNLRNELARLESRINLLATEVAYRVHCCCGDFLSGLDVARDGRIFYLRKVP